VHPRVSELFSERRVRLPSTCREADEPPVEEKPEQNGRMRPDGSPTQRPFHEIANHQQSALSCTHYNSTDVSFGKTPGDVNRDHQVIPINGAIFLKQKPRLEA